MQEARLTRRRTKRAVTLAALAVACAVAPVLAASAPIPLFPAKAPGEQGPVEAEKFILPPDGKKPDVQRLTNVSEPSLTVFPAAADRANGTALIIAPGGGYSILAWDLEGEEVARRFNDFGVTTFLLKYRVPLRSHDPQAQLPLMDAQRAVSLVRSRAKEWGVDPKKVGLLGFSAGGNLAAHTSTQYEQRAYPAADAIDQVSCRPDFTVLIYPWKLLDPKDHAQLAPRLKVTANTPPTFVAVAADDKLCVDDAVRYWQELKTAGVKNELHVYNNGGHGFGLRPRAGAAASWPERCAEWLRTVGVLPPTSR